MSMFNSVMRCMPMSQNDQQVDESVHKWHLPSWYSIISSPCILKCRIITSSIPKCHAKHCNVNNISLQINNPFDN